MRRLERTIVTFFIAAATAALCLGSQPVEAQTFMTEDPYFALRLGTAAVSAEASHEVSFNVSAGELEATRVQLTYPNDFAFNGFDALGSTNSRIGSLRFVAAGTGVIFPVRSRDVDSAYGDADANGVYTVGSDPIIEYSRSRADQQLTVYLPLGGDFDASTTTSPSASRISRAESPVSPSDTIRPSRTPTWPLKLAPPVPSMIRPSRMSKSSMGDE